MSVQSSLTVVTILVTTLKAHILAVVEMDIFWMEMEEDALVREVVQWSV